VIFSICYPLFKILSKIHPNVGLALPQIRFDPRFEGTTPQRVIL
jgi:hypothetical protein